MQFEWNSLKAFKNRLKHGVTFEEASSVFSDVFSKTLPDLDHSIDEERFVTIGISLTGKILLLSHTDRGRKVRIISARKATPRERRYYEETKR